MCSLCLICCYVAYVVYFANVVYVVHVVYKVHVVYVVYVAYVVYAVYAIRVEQSGGYQFFKRQYGLCVVQLEDKWLRVLSETVNSEQSRGDRK